MSETTKNHKQTQVVQISFSNAVLDAIDDVRKKTLSHNRQDFIRRATIELIERVRDGDGDVDAE